MIDSLYKFLVPGLIGLVSGAIGSLIAPWMKWRLENKRSNRVDRINFLNEAREYVEKVDVKSEEFLNSPLYSRIRAYLSTELVQDLENQRKVIMYNGLRDGYRARVLEELNNLEYHWKVGLPKPKNKNHSSIKDSAFLTISAGDGNTTVGRQSKKSK